MIARYMKIACLYKEGIDRHPVVNSTLMQPDNVTPVNLISETGKEELGGRWEAGVQ